MVTFVTFLLFRVSMLSGVFAPRTQKPAIRTCISVHRIAIISHAAPPNIYQSFRIAYSYAKSATDLRSRSASQIVALHIILLL